jgi:hypothetical protein
MSKGKPLAAIVSLQNVDLESLAFSIRGHELTQEVRSDRHVRRRTDIGCEVDHVVSEKHGGPTEAENLAYACFVCNHRKGSDIASILWRTGELVRSYNPRKDRWAEHLRLQQARIEPLSPIGEITCQMLRFKDEQSVLERPVLIVAGRYPGPAALARMFG